MGWGPRVLAVYLLTVSAEHPGLSLSQAFNMGILLMKRKQRSTETGPATVTQASSLVHEWALSWGGHSARAWGGAIRARLMEWQCPGQGGEGPRPLAPASGLRISGPSLLPSVSWMPHDTKSGCRKGASHPRSKCHCPGFFFLIITSLRDNYKFTFCSAQSFIQSLRGRPGCKRRIDVCFRVAGVTG